MDSRCFRRRNTGSLHRREICGDAEPFCADRFYHTGEGILEVSYHRQPQRFTVFKIKENPEIVVEKTYVKLNVEKYGGMLMAPWFDRPLSIAGRVIVRKDGKLEEKLIDFDRNLVMIPNLAIHMNREANSGVSYNPQKDMLPLFSMGGSDVSLQKLLSTQLDVEEKIS